MICIKCKSLIDFDKFGKQSCDCGITWNAGRKPKDWKIPVKRYRVEYGIGANDYCVDVLAENLLSANIIDRGANLTYLKISELDSSFIGLADYSARVISGEDEEFYLNYHCTPFYS